jgi:hypothetical protein
VRAVLLVTREKSFSGVLSLSLPIGTFQTLYPISSLYRLSFFFLFVSPYIELLFCCCCCCCWWTWNWRNDRSLHDPIVDPPLFFPPS